MTLYLKMNFTWCSYNVCKVSCFYQKVHSSVIFYMSIFSSTILFLGRLSCQFNKSLRCVSKISSFSSLVIISVCQVYSMLHSLRVIIWIVTITYFIIKQLRHSSSRCISYALRCSQALYNLLQLCTKATAYTTDRVMQAGESQLKLYLNYQW